MHEQEFRDYVDAYIGAIHDTHYREVSKLQPGPFATLAHGGAGTAYALWRMGDRRRASTWVAASLADRRAFSFSQHTIDMPAPITSVMFGRAGARWVDVLS